MTFQRSDYIILSIICFFLGILFVSEYYTSREYKKIIQPENNAVLAIEVSKQTKVNANLRREVADLTSDLDNYHNSSESRKKTYDQYLLDVERLGAINGEKAVFGQGIIISIDGTLNAPEVVDFVNALKNIGAEIISINGKRLVLNSDINEFSGSDHYEIKVIGNSSLLKSAMERKGGIIEQISRKDLKFNIAEKENIEAAVASSMLKFQYSKRVD